MGKERSILSRARDGADLGEALGAALPETAAPLLRAVRGLASDRGEAVYLVGGAVRDFLLGRPIQDLDWLVEGDALAFAAALARELDLQIRVHAAFLTADLLGLAGLATSVAGSRREHYPRPAALPEVAPAPLEADLARRDFTVNTLLLQPMEAGSWRLRDRCDGLGALRRGSLEVLHDDSFVDDPTRILRGIRFEARLGFRFGTKTLALAAEERARNALDRLSGDRLRRELLRLFAESEGVEWGVRRLGELGLLQVLSPKLQEEGQAAAAAVRRAWSQLGEASAPSALGPLVLAAMFAALPEGGRRRIAERLRLEPAAARLIISGLERSQAAVAGLEEPHASPSRIYQALRSVPRAELILATALAEEPLAGWARRELQVHRRMKPTLTGDDLRALGVPEGPEIGRLLTETRAALLDGEIDPSGELDFVQRRWAAREPGRSRHDG